MKNVIGVVAVVSVLSLFPLCMVEGAKQATYTSEKPVYAKVAVTEDGSKALSVVFDESQGTGKGHDLLYADADFNGVFEDSEKLAPEVARTIGADGLFCFFPPVKVNVPYNDKAKEVSDPYDVKFAYRKEPGPAESTAKGSSSTAGQPSSATATTSEYFDAFVTIRLREDSGTWEHSFIGAMKPAESVEKAPVWSFSSPPALNIATQPDGVNMGKIGIELKIMAGEIRVESTKNGEQVKAHVEMKRPDGKVVHRGDEFLGQFWFG